MLTSFIIVLYIVPQKHTHIYVLIWACLLNAFTTYIYVKIFLLYFLFFNSFLIL